LHIPHSFMKTQEKRGIRRRGDTLQMAVLTGKKGRKKSLKERKILVAANCKYLGKKKNKGGSCNLTGMYIETQGETEKEGW